MIWSDEPTACTAQPAAFDDDHGDRDTARLRWLRTLCARCPLLDPCHTYAMTTPTHVAGGFMAGMTERDRKAAQTRARAEGNVA